MSTKTNSPANYDTGIHLVAAITAAVVSSLVFLPLLGYKGHMATFMFGSDPFDFWLPQLNLLQHYVKSGVFQGLDYYTHNGSAEWFLRPNLTAYYPPYLIAAFFTQTDDLIFQAGVILVIEYIGTFVALYYAILLANRFFSFDRSLSIFIAVGFTFSWHFLIQAAYISFGYVAWLMPPVIYYSLAVVVAPNLRNISAGAFAGFCMMTAGYLPLSFQALSLSGLLVGFYLFNERRHWGSVRAFGLAALRAAIPVGIAVLVTAPWIWAIVRYSKSTIQPSFKDNIVYSAYELSELPQSMLRALSGNIKVPGPFYEFSPTIGLAAFIIFLLFISIGRDTVEKVATPEQRRSLWFGMAVFVLCWLIVYGSHSPLAAVFYFFAPIASFSHLYQRYMPMAQLFLILATAQMLRVIILVERPRLERFWLATMSVVVLTLCVLAGLGLNNETIGFTQELIGEAFYVVVFLITLIAVRGKAVVWVAMLAMFLPALDRGYEHSTLPELSFAKQQPLHLPLNDAAVAEFDAQLASFGAQKDIIKVVDVTPGVHGYIPVNYPWFRAQNITLSWYNGYDWHVGVPLEYREVNPVGLGADGELRFMPSPQWVAATGADVLIYDPRDRDVSSNLLALIDPSRPALTVPYAGGQYVMAPLRQDHAPVNPAADNGYFRLAAEGAISSFATNGAGNFDFDVSATTPGALQYQFWPTDRLWAYVNDSKVEMYLNPEGIMSIPVPAGHSHVTVRYHNLFLDVFLIFYAVFIATLSAIVLWLALLQPLLRWRRSRAARRAGLPGRTASIPDTSASA